MRNTARARAVRGIRLTTLLVAALVVVMALPVGAIGRSGFLTSWRSDYPTSLSDDNASCTLCHGPDDDTSLLNAYGKAIQDGGTSAAQILAIGGANSDGDSGGLTNAQEIAANAQPGWRDGPNNTLYDVGDGSLVSTGNLPPSNIGLIDPAAAPTPTPVPPTPTPVPPTPTPVPPTPTPVPPTPTPVPPTPTPVPPTPTPVPPTPTPVPPTPTPVPPTPTPVPPTPTPVPPTPTPVPPTPSPSLSPTPSPTPTPTPDPTDTTKPVATVPTVAIRSGAALFGTAIPVTIRWSGSDTGGSGIAHFELSKSLDEGSTWAVVTASTAASSTRMTVSSSGSILFRVRAVDVAGNIGDWVTTAAITPRLTQDASSAVVYKGKWTRQRDSRFSARSVRFASAAKASATTTTTNAKSIALVTTTARNRGYVRVYVNGVLQGRYNLKSASTRYRVVVWQTAWTNAAPRTIKLVVEGTFGRPRVDLDAIATLN